MYKQYIIPENEDLTDKKVKPVTTVKMNDQKTRAEVLWALKISDANFAHASCDDVGIVFQEMFTDSLIAKKFQMGSSKVSYVICDGLGPFFVKQVVSQIPLGLCTPYTLMRPPQFRQKKSSMSLLDITSIPQGRSTLDF